MVSAKVSCYKYGSCCNFWSRSAFLAWGLFLYEKSLLCCFSSSMKKSPDTRAWKFNPPPTIHPSWMLRRVGKKHTGCWLLQLLYRLTGTVRDTIPEPIPVMNLPMNSNAWLVAAVIRIQPITNGAVQLMMVPFLPRASTVHPPITLPTAAPGANMDWKWTEWWIVSPIMLVDITLPLPSSKMTSSQP